ncbi:MAG: 50S ribosomal protein L10 [Nanoarchaeota archaeon]|nr:50S ribosomal protein L10 [Nanoarchaeota archaeon]
MVSIKKKEMLKKIVETLGEYPVIGILNMHKLPAKQLCEIRSKLHDEAVIRMVKKRIILLALKEKKMTALEEFIKDEPALLFTKSDPFKLAKVIAKSKTKAPAKGGDIAPSDILIKAGPTNLPPGPVIGELQRLKIPAMVDGEKIAVKKDTVVVKEGEKISVGLADVLTKLGIEPMEIGLNLSAVWEDGIVYEKDVLFVPTEKYLEDILKAHSQAFNLSINIGYVTKENVPFLLSKAYREALALAETAGIPTKETIGKLLKKGQDQAKILEPKIKTEQPKQKKEKQKEEKPKDDSKKKKEG